MILAEKGPLDLTIAIDHSVPVSYRYVPRQDSNLKNYCIFLSFVTMCRRFEHYKLQIIVLLENGFPTIGS